MTEKMHLDPEALVSYLYDECEPAQRAAMAAHLDACAVCAGEVAALTATRRDLAGWAPPDIALGFQITRTVASDTPPARVLRPETPAPSGVEGWWSRPLPAWAQAAAALLVFGAGLAIGARNADVQPQSAPAEQSAAAERTSVETADATLAREVELLRAELASVKRASTVSSPAPRTDALSMEQVRELVETSARDQRIEFTARFAELARNVEVGRTGDRQVTAATINRLQAQAAAEALRQQRDIEALAVGLTPVAGR